MHRCRFQGWFLYLLGANMILTNLLFFYLLAFLHCIFHNPWLRGVRWRDTRAHSPGPISNYDARKLLFSTTIMSYKLQPRLIRGMTRVLLVYILSACYIHLLSHCVKFSLKVNGYHSEIPVCLCMGIDGSVLDDRGSAISCDWIHPSHTLPSIANYEQ